MNVLVTGCSRGIGKEIIKNLLETSSSINNIIAISRSSIKVKYSASKTKLHILNTDLSDFKKFPNTIIKYLKQNNINQIDVLINNAGAIINKPFQKITTTDLDKIYDINLKSPFILIQTLLPYFKKSKNSHIVNISSMGGFMGSTKFSGLSAYSSSKGALVTLTECLAEEFKDKNIHVNCLCIGAVNTEMLRKAFPNYKAHTSPVQMAQYIVSFALNQRNMFNGKTLPVSSSTP